MSSGWRLEFILGKDAAHLGGLINPESSVVYFTDPAGSIYWFRADSEIGRGVLSGVNTFSDTGANGNRVVFAPPPDIMARVREYLVCYQVTRE